MDPCNPLPPVDEELDLPVLSRVRQILFDARRVLADPDKQRWSDKDLLAFLNEGLIDFCTKTRILRKKSKITLTTNEALFDLPEDCWQVLRVTYKNGVLPIVTREELDTKPLPNYLAAWRPGPNWADDTGKPLAVLFDMLDFHQGELYPVPGPEEEELVETEDFPFGFIVVDSTHVHETPLPSVFGIMENGEDDFGVVTTVEGGELFDDFGVISQVIQHSTYPQETFAGAPDFDSEDMFGIVDTFVDGNVNAPLFGIVDTAVDSTTETTFEVPMQLEIYYLKSPRPIRRYNQRMEIPEMYDRAIQFYVAGQAFLSDIDAGSQQKAVQQLGLYTNIVDSVKKDTSMNWSRRGSFTIGYRRGV